ncbi:kinesin [Thraustotheca clavata]|uniref:Kinesin n=1 Tax=Thraustotheca clavata TaxID=74557 RepID=A0A1W0A637_9STRA|nr:kinesin [Thraustotheca clavata]
MDLFHQPTQYMEQQVQDMPIANIHVGLNSPHYVDVEMTNELAMEIIESKLHGFGQIVETMDIKIGFNNRCYGIRTIDDVEYILRLTKDSWPETKIIAEAAALAAVKFYEIDIPVPKLIAYDEKSYPSLGVRWMLMQKMPGICLDNAWENASSEQRKYIAEQLKSILTKMQLIEFEKIGGWTFNKEIPTLGPYFEDGAGPFDSEKEWILSQFNKQVQKAQTNKILAPLRNLIEPATNAIMNYLERFIPAKIVLFHGDFAFRNLLVDENCTITEERTSSSTIPTPSWHRSMIRVRNGIASAEFYQNICGLHLYGTQRNPDSTSYFLGSIQQDTSKPEWLNNQLGTILELREFDNAPSEYTNGNTEPRGFGHLALLVDDVYETCSAMEELNVAFQKKPDDGRMKGLAFIKDIDGYWIEIIRRQSLIHHYNICSGMESSVRVVVRVRPLVPKEKLDDDVNIAVETFGSQVMIPSSNITYTYDHVFGPEAGQDDLWPCVSPLVDSTFEGYNATIFAYGQTGSGKTFTMGSGNSAFVSNTEERGIIPRALHNIFDRIENKKKEIPGYSADVTFRFLEIYGEEIRDLLSQFGNGTLDTNSKVYLKEAANGQVIVHGAREESVLCADECIKLLDKGSFCRTVGATDMNSESSRSHAILTITMTQHIPFTPAEGATGDAVECDVRSCYFNFVDLAGSEKQKMTKAEGIRLKEGIDINKGLFVLGNVINALGDDTRRGRVHVPYRDSKLTRMLQDSLGGNSRTLMLCCVSPAGRNISESKSSLMYANRARNIQNKAHINRDEQSNVVAELRRQVQLLQEELFQFRNPGADMNDPRVQSAASEWRLDSFGSMRQRTEAAENEVLRLTSEIKRWRTETDAIKEELLVTQGQRDYFRMCCEGSGTGLLDANGEEMGLVKEQLKTIQELQEKLRQAEGERDKAHMYSSHSHELDMSAFGLTAEVLEEEQRLIEQAEQEIKREQEMLKQIQEQAVFSDNVDMEDDDEGNEGMIEMEIMQREFQKRQQVLGASVQDLSNNISLKEQMLQTLRRNAEGYERMRGVFEQKLKEMAEKERVFMVERERLIGEMNTLKVSDPPRYHKLSVDLESKDGELSALRKKQAEMRRFEVMKQKSDVQLRVLTNEISTMKRQKVDLLRKMQADRKKYEMEANERKREIISLKREHQRDRKQIQKLGNEKDAQERVLKRRMEEVAAANRRLKQQQLLLQANRKSNKNKPKSKDEEWLANQIKKLADQQKKAELLEKELEKREKIVNQMERLYGMRNKLQEELKQSIVERSTGDSSAIRDILISPMKGADEDMGKEEEAMLAELEERIEACQAQLEYKDERINEMTNNTIDLDDDEAMIKMENSSLPEARTLLKLLFGMAVNVKKQEEAKDGELQSTLLRLEELETNLRLEKERNNFMRQTYEEKLRQMIADAMNQSSDDAPESQRLVLSASEEQNTVLRKKCDELEAQQGEWEAEKAHLLQRNHKYKHGMTTCRERIRWLEAQLDVTKRDSSFLPPPAPISTAHDADDDDDNCDVMSIGSASSDTSFTPANNHGSNIFNRLSNPSNFTGIHRHRLQEKAKQKRDILKDKSESIRMRRFKDRNLPAPPTNTNSRLRQPTNYNLTASPRVRSSTPRHQPPPLPLEGLRRNSGTALVMDVLENLKKENTLEMTEDYDMENEHSDSVSEGGYGDSPKKKKDVSDTMSEGGYVDRRDVFSRLSNSYTASSQSKRQSFVNDHRPHVRPIARDHSLRDENEHSPRHHARQTDPLTGGERFVTQVLDDVNSKMGDIR